MKYGCIGEKLGHSFSAEIHAMLGDYRYELRPMPPQELPDFMREHRFCGINVTIPYKQAVIPFLDEIDPTAAAIGAVNTVVNRNGRLIGYNTDLFGMGELCRKIGLSLSGRKVLIAGSGGTSKTAMALCRQSGAAAALRLSRTAQDGCLSYEQALARHRDAQVLINTTPLGMFGHPDCLPLNPADFPRLTGALDAVYNPLRTGFVKAAEQVGVPAAGGLYMLVAQAEQAAAHFFDRAVDESRIERVYQTLYAQKQNIVLIGMPGSGKSTVGQALAAALGREFLDTDAEIVKQTGQDIPSLMAAAGEAGFRQTESDVIAAVSARQGLVIATGGGAVLRPENAAALKKNGRLYWLDRPPEQLPVTADRPLSNSPDKLQSLYRTRYPIYRAAADCRVDNSGRPETAVKRIQEAHGL